MIIRKPIVGIISTLGIPPRYGAFESTAWELSKYLSQHNFNVIVASTKGLKLSPTETIPSNVSKIEFWRTDNSIGDILYDLQSIVSFVNKIDLAIIFGFAAAPFFLIFKLFNIPIILNPDGFEWLRPKFSRSQKFLLKQFQYIAVKSSEILIADSPIIQKYYQDRFNVKTLFAAYGADYHDVDETDLPFSFLEPYNYFLIIARLEPSVLIDFIITEYLASNRKEKLIIIGNGDDNYLNPLKKQNDGRLIFTGGYYGDRKGLFSIRKFCLAYIDGHHTGGINPSTIEAMLSGRHIIAHNNGHIKAALGNTFASYYNLKKGDLTNTLNNLNHDNIIKLNTEYIERANSNFSWEKICGIYLEAIKMTQLHNNRLIQRTTNIQ